MTWDNDLLFYKHRHIKILVLEVSHIKKPGDKTSASWKIFENILNIFLSAWKLIEYSPFSEYCCYCSVTQLRPTLCDPMDRSMPGLPVHHQLPEFTQTRVHVMPSNHLILCQPLLLQPSIFPSVRVFSNESVLHITWPKYWSFSFSISPSIEYSLNTSLGWTGWISLMFKGLSKVFSKTTVQKHQFFSV